MSTPDLIMAIAIGTIVLFAVGYWWARMVFSVGKQLENQKKIIELLTEINKKK